MTNTVLTPVCSAVTSVGGAPPENFMHKYVNIGMIRYQVLMDWGSWGPDPPSFLSNHAFLCNFFFVCMLTELLHFLNLSLGYD